MDAPHTTLRSPATGVKKKEGHEMVIGVPVELSDEAVYVESQTEARWLSISDLKELYLVETEEEAVE